MQALFAIYKRTNYKSLANDDLNARTFFKLPTDIH